MMTRIETTHGSGTKLATCLGLSIGLIAIAGTFTSAPALAASDTVEVSKRDIEMLREQIRHQRQLIEEQRRRLEQQSHRLNRLERELETRAASRKELEEHRGAGTGGSRARTQTEGTTGGPATSPNRTEEQDGPQTAQDRRDTDQETPERVGQPSEAEEQRPEVAALAEEGGILTPRGTLIVEPSIEFAHTSTNRFVFNGFELAEVVLIGVIEASEADRNAITPALTLRYGVTSRFEFDVKVPWVWRNDRVTNTIVDTSPQTSQTRDLTSSGIGDVEFGFHYQLNKSHGRWPYFIANLRVKTPTGRGPFDVDRNSQGIETELSTGSGFWGIEPSITMIYPSEPAVFFMSVGYVWNIASDVDEVIGGSTFGRVDPGDAVRGTIGMGLSINDRSSFSIGYKHDYIFGTSFEINGRTQRSQPLHSGSVFIGFSHRVNRRWGVNVTIEGGVTDDAPDARILFRIPIRFNLLADGSA